MQTGRQQTAQRFRPLISLLKGLEPAKRDNYLGELWFNATRNGNSADLENLSEITIAVKRADFK